MNKATVSSLSTDCGKCFNIFKHYVFLIRFFEHCNSQVSLSLLMYCVRCTFLIQSRTSCSSGAHCQLKRHKEEILSSLKDQFYVRATDQLIKMGIMLSDCQACMVLRPYLDWSCWTCRKDYCLWTWLVERRMHRKEMKLTFLKRLDVLAVTCRLPETLNQLTLSHLSNLLNLLGYSSF